jgi:hypothetical protein
VLHAAVGSKQSSMILPGRDTRDSEAAAGTNQRRSAAVTTATDAFPRGAAGWGSNRKAQPVLVHAVDAVAHTPQPVIGTQHPWRPLPNSPRPSSSTLAPSPRLRQRQHRHPSGGRVQFDQGEVDRGRGWRRHAARVDDTRLTCAWRPVTRIRWLRRRWATACAAVSSQRWWISVPAAVAVEEGDDRRPVGLVDQAVRVGAVVP